MEVRLHKKARTTLEIRKEIKESKESIYALAKKYNLHYYTVKKWKERENVLDKSSRPHKLNITLNKEQEDLILFERKQKKLSCEDIYCVLKDKIPNLYPVKVWRTVARAGLGTLPEEFIKEERKIKKFKNYSIGYLHLDTLYVPKINKIRYYIFTCIDRVSKLVYIKVVRNKSMKNSSIFLKEVLKFYPYKINYILTDNGQEFCYKALAKSKKTKKEHLFVQVCKDNKINHRTIKFRHPWTNGQVESINKKIKYKVLTKYIFSDIVDLESKLYEFINYYNTEAKLKTLKYLSPKEYLLKNYDILFNNEVSNKGS
ncbi:MAG: integrase core domain-containing protein [Candidatus Anstonellales archaeon]